MDDGGRRAGHEGGRWTASSPPNLDVSGSRPNPGTASTYIKQLLRR
ncbi:hypothetical protein BJY22_004833 [Kribbella shirazensis]|uniref:Uncharacterized protein n=1 Tax=Kribbella shirazensis TaxID=1105143 RepID=A0A7X5VE50_9ACTN|nr:hypothetical protein [Kribbella shirazensis]